MKKKLALVMAFVMFLSVALFVSCSKEVSGQPNFIFKPAPKTGVVAKINGVEISEQEMASGIENDIYDAQMKVYDLKLGKLKSLVLEKLMEAHPKKKGLTNDQFLESVIAGSKGASEKEIMAFAKERNIPQDQLNPQIKERIKQFLDAEMKKQLIEKWMAEQTKKNPVEIYLEKPERPVFIVPEGDAPFKGGADAKVTIVEYTDFECPYCGKASVTMRDLYKKYGNKIKIVFKNFPLAFHTNAQYAHEASMCVNEQGMDKFWKFYANAYDNQNKLDKANLDAMIKTLGVDFAKFEACVKDKKFKAYIEKDSQDGQKIGVRSTPTFFVNGKLISGAQPIEVFSEEIDAELNKK